LTFYVFNVLPLISLLAVAFVKLLNQFFCICRYVRLSRNVHPRYSDFDDQLVFSLFPTWAFGAFYGK